MNCKALEGGILTKAFFVSRTGFPRLHGRKTTFEDYYGCSFYQISNFFFLLSPKKKKKHTHTHKDVAEKLPRLASLSNFDTRWRNMEEKFNRHDSRRKMLEF